MTEPIPVIIIDCDGTHRGLLTEDDGLIITEDGE
jgi:hypothetical protein